MGVAVLKLYFHSCQMIFIDSYSLWQGFRVARPGLEFSSSCYSLLSELYTYTPTSNNFTMSEKEVMLIVYSYMQLVTIDWMLLIHKPENWKKLQSEHFLFHVCVHVCARTRYFFAMCAHGSQPLVDWFSLSPRGFLGSMGSAWWRVPLPSEPSCSP